MSISSSDTIDQVCRLFEHGGSIGVQRASRRIGPAYRWLCASGAIVRAPPRRWWSCNDCSEPHDANIEVDEVDGEHRYFCPERGSKIVNAVRLEQVRVDGHLFAKLCATAVADGGPASAREIIPASAWELRPGHDVDSRPVVVARAIDDLVVWSQLVEFCSRLRPRKTGWLLSSTEMPVGASAPTGFEFIRLADAVELNQYGMSIARSASASVKRSVGSRRGRPGWSRRIREILEERLDAGQALRAIGREASIIRDVLLAESTARSPRIPGARHIEQTIRPRHQEAFPRRVPTSRKSSR